MSASHGVGGAWHPASAYWVGVGATWRPVFARWVGVGGKWVLKFAATTVSLVTAYVRGACPTPGTATAQWSIRSDGKILSEWTNQTFLDSLYGADWVSPAANASQFEVRATKLSGNADATGAALGAWLNCGTTRTWSVSTNVADVVSSCTLTIELRKVGDTVTRLSVPITLSTSVRTGGTPTYGTGVGTPLNYNRPNQQTY